MEDLITLSLSLSWENLCLCMQHFSMAAQNFLCFSMFDTGYKRKGDGGGRKDA